MSTEVRISYVWTLDEIRRATEVWRRVNNVVIVSDWWGLILIYGILVAYSAWRVQLSNDLSEQGIVISVLVLPCVMLFVLTGRDLFPYSKVTGCEGSPDLDHPIRHTITEERWRIETQVTRCESDWSFVKSVSREREGFVVFTHENSVRWFPIHGFESEAAITTFVRMVESHDVKYEDRRRA